jgi:hypothetical protein
VTASPVIASDPASTALGAQSASGVPGSAAASQIGTLTSVPCGTTASAVARALIKKRTPTRSAIAIRGPSGRRCSAVFHFIAPSSRESHRPARVASRTGLFAQSGTSIGCPRAVGIGQRSRLPCANSARSTLRMARWARLWIARARGIESAQDRSSSWRSGGTARTGHAGHAIRPAPSREPSQMIQLGDASAVTATHAELGTR